MYYMAIQEQWHLHQQNLAEKMFQKQFDLNHWQFGEQLPPYLLNLEFFLGCSLHGSDQNILGRDATRVGDLFLCSAAFHFFA